MTLAPIFVWSPNGSVDARTTVAASRAGALGVIDLAWEPQPAMGRGVMARAASLLQDRPFGVHIQAERIDGGLLESRPPVVIALGGLETPWTSVRERIEASGSAAAASVTSRRAAVAAWEAGFEAIVISGNEAGGEAAEESAFILLQGVLADLPREARIWVRGGIGPATAAGCFAAGATGVVLDGAVLLTRESPLAPEIRERIAHWDGVETGVHRNDDGRLMRGFVAPNSPLAREFREMPDGVELSGRMGWAEGRLWPVGQDACFASQLARDHVTVGGVVKAVEESIAQRLRSARHRRPLDEGCPLAAAHGTRYPIVQGPMTRVSDRAAFARSVAEGGGLPFLALAMLKGAEVRTLLEETASLLGDRPWGVGLLGFVTPELRREQTEAVLAIRPRFALIAGGRPDQAKNFEDVGIPAYLHAPSPGLLTQFLRDGARRFVLEGRECGGHVGPRSSFVLWEQAGRVVAEAIAGGIDGREIQLLYAGGVHDARSGAVVSAVSAELVELGVKVGVLVGTAYLFTEEAVASGAIVEGFQQEALRCDATVLLETGPGHLVRVSPTPFTDRFEHERRRMLAEKKTNEEIRTTLETLNVGRLRVAAKGVDRGDVAGRLVEVAASDQFDHGLYMLGQAATLRRELTTISQLHSAISRDGSTWLERPYAAEIRTDKPRPKPRPSDVAIIGMAAIVPGAGDVQTFWTHTLEGRDAITEVPLDRWDWRPYFNADPKAPDKITSRWGGFVPDVPFDPLTYGMPPTSLTSIEPLHLLTLEAVRAALDDAGYGRRAFPRDRTAVVLGAGGGAAQLAMGYAFRSYLPLLDTAIPGAGTEALARCGDLLPEWTEDSFPGILLNVAAGRVANRFDLGGANYTVDAACGSSLAAAALAVRELESGAADMVLLGGADTVQNPFTYLAFSKTQAFSSRGRCRPFDAKADGIVISEAVAVVVLKRLADAERDGDRIYGVIKGLGASSDGRAKGLTAPRFEGQIRALERSYEKAGVSPATIGYVEAHGTGTAAGDLAEVSALKQVFSEAGAEAGACGLGSVKSLIGHTKCAAGLAGLINATLALHHRVLPPTIGVETPNPKAEIDGSPFHLSVKPRPWLKTRFDQPRRAGVSAFGFGGTNFHAVVEAYEGDAAPPTLPVLDWPAELFVWRQPDRSSLIAELKESLRAFEASNPPLRHLAHTLHHAARAVPNGPSLALVARSLEELRDKLARALPAIESGADPIHEPNGLDYESSPSGRGAKVALLFPGQGSQYPEMLGELTVLFPELLDHFERTDCVLAEHGRATVGRHVFPPPTFSPEEADRQKRSLAATAVAQPALGAASTGLLSILRRLGLHGDAYAGHSYGELVALHAAGVFDNDALALISEARGRFLVEAVGEEPGAMAAVQASVEAITQWLAESDGVVVANGNAPTQTVVSGPTEAVTRFIESARKRGVRAAPLPVSCGFHSPLVAGASQPLVEMAAPLVQSAPTKPVYSNVTTGPYENDRDSVAPRLGEHLARPVRFAEMIESMYGDGFAVFVEVGPNSVLTGLVDAILGDRPHLAVATDPPGRKGVEGLLASLGRLFAAGVSLDLDGLTAPRGALVLKRGAAGFESIEPPLSPTTWLVNGNRVRPASAPEPKTFGSGAPLPPAIEKSTASSTQSTNGHTAPTKTKLPDRPLAAISSPRPAGSAEVMAAFQQTMQNFLDVQRATMLGYLGTAATATPQAEPTPGHNGLHKSNGHASNGFANHPSAPQRRQPAASEKPSIRPQSASAPEPARPEVNVERRLLAIVRDRTGYPEEMLRLDLDMEADLGIDSIKRVEILGTLREGLPSIRNGSETELMDQLARARTLGAVVERVVRHLGDDRVDQSSSSGTEAAPPPKPAADSDVRRMLVEPIDAPIDPTRTGELVAGGIVLITDDGRSVARRLAAELGARGFRPVRLVSGTTSAMDEATVDLTSENSVARLADEIRRRGNVTGLVHLLPLREFREAELDPAAWSERIGTEMRGLYLLARAFADDLANAGRTAGSALIAATAMGGGFASTGDVPSNFFPGHGAIAGLVKTLAREWNDVRTRVVDVDADDGVDSLAERFIAELFANDDVLEAGYLDGRRIRLEPVVAPIEPRSEDLFIKAGEPILITGGARGITAAVAEQLARLWRPTLLLVGTSPLPPERDPAELEGIDEPSVLKARLLEQLDRGGRTVKPAELEKAYQSLRRDREIRANLERLRASGAKVEYAAVDVRDAEAMKTMLDGWRTRYGPPVGLIHGAGVIQDKLLRDKTPVSFDRVVSTKLDGALTLARLLDPTRLRFTAFFSSIAGRFGNRGQADYSAANDALNKLAVWLDRRWPGRLVSLNWGPWAGVGMVSDLEKHLGRQGLGMIEPMEGCRRLCEELRFAPKGDVEVIVAGCLGNLASPLEAASRS